MACGEGCGLGCGGIGRALVGGCAIAFCAISAGAVHSWLRPVALRPDTKSIQATVIPANPKPSDTTPPGVPQTPDVTAPAAAQADPGSGVTLGYKITSEQAKLLFDMGVPFVDAREPNFFAEGHVERAMNITADQVFGDPKNTALLARYRPGPIVVYCSGGDCDASEHVAQRLQDLQFTQIHVMSDGFPGWKAKGYPVAVGAQ